MVTTIPRTSPATAATAARLGLWLLPVHALLLAVSTLTHQPDKTAFDAYARYVTTTPFLASHLGASIGGAALGALGAVAALAYLVQGRGAGAGVLGASLLVAGQVATTAVFGAAAFAQPAVGRAHLRGVVDAAAIDADVYGPPLFGTAIVGVLLLLVGSIALGVAVVRAGEGDRALRRAGVVYAVAVPLFLVFGLVFTLVQPVPALVAAGAAVVVARRLPRV